MNTANRIAAHRATRFVGLTRLSYSRITSASVCASFPADLPDGDLVFFRGRPRYRIGFALERLRLASAQAAYLRRPPVSGMSPSRPLVQIVVPWCRGASLVHAGAKTARYDYLGNGTNSPAGLGLRRTGSARLQSWLVPGTGLEPASQLRRRIFVTLLLSKPAPCDAVRALDYAFAVVRTRLSPRRP